MNNKYQRAVCLLSEILVETNKELKWKEDLLAVKNKEIEKLKTKLEYIENFFDQEVSNRK